MELVQRDEPAGLQRHAGKLLARPPEQQLLRPASTREACEQSRRRRPPGSRFVHLLVLPPSSLPCYIHATPHPFFPKPLLPNLAFLFHFPALLHSHRLPPCCLNLSSLPPSFRLYPLASSFILPVRCPATIFSLLIAFPLFLPPHLLLPFALLELPFPLFSPLPHRSHSSLQSLFAVEFFSIRLSKEAFVALRNVRETAHHYGHKQNICLNTAISGIYCLFCILFLKL